MSNTTSIRISKDLKKKLEQLGTMGDTFDSLIRKLVECYEKANNV